MGNFCTFNKPCDYRVLYYCDMPDEVCGRQRDLQKGTCEMKPSSCEIDIDPICGCDGVTYDNACWGAANGVNVWYKGECKGNDIEIM